MTAESAVRFFSANRDQYSPLSNFHRCSLRIDGVSYPSVEHYYQSRKFCDPRYQDEIRRAKTPFLAKRLGRTTKHKMLPQWEEIKEDVMRTALQAKFSQYPALRQLLFNTGDRVIIEDSPYDAYWGRGKSGTGLNRMGELLMELRRSWKTSKDND